MNITLISQKSALLILILSLFISFYYQLNRILSIRLV